MPKNFVGSRIIHCGWPNGEDRVSWVQGAIVEQSLVLSHSVVKRDIIVLHPATKRMEQKKWVFVSFLDQLVSAVLEQQAMAVMQRVSNLECVNSICVPLLGNLCDLVWLQSVLVETVVVLNLASELH